MPKYTLEDIAKISGVSRSTVSRVINNSPNVKESVRLRVQEVVRQTGYHPHPAARSLATQRTSIIGLVIPRSVHTVFTDPYFPNLTQGVSQACTRNDYTLSLFLFHNEEDERRLFPRLGYRGFVDGIIIQSSAADEVLLAQLKDSDVPFVMAGRPLTNSNVSYVDVDNVTGAHNAVRHLVHLGRRRIGTITGPLITSPGSDRFEGYKKALEDSNIDFDGALFTEGDFSESSGYFNARQLLAHGPDALFVASDIMAIGALRAIRESGLAVPEDISIVSFDDLPAATQASPPLTTIRQPIQQMGVNLVETLLDIIENGPIPPRRTVFTTELVIRESCGATRRILAR
jgi:LacI family transcriptional regulator